MPLFTVKVSIPENDSPKGDVSLGLGEPALALSELHTHISEKREMWIDSPQEVNGGMVPDL
jgi:hypothetical protein